MYDKIQRQKKKSGTGLRSVLPIVLVILLLGVGIFSWAVNYRIQYRNFVSHLSNSNVYARENLSIHADVDGNLVWVKRDNAHKLYQYILVNGSGRVCRPPKHDPEIVIEYGDGGLLKIYEAEQENFRVCLYYTHTDGFSYCYASSKMSLATFKISYLDPSDNGLWHEPVG